MEKELTGILDRLIGMLCAERGEPVPALDDEQKPDYFRALCNVRPPAPVTEEFLRLQDEYLSARTRERGIVDVGKLAYDADGIALWRGDITRLNADAIVNACNPALLGCFRPLHGCIDNIIHSNAGVQVRLDCDAMMRGGEARHESVQPSGQVYLPHRRPRSRRKSDRLGPARPRKLLRFLPGQGGGNGTTLPRVLLHIHRSIRISEGGRLPAGGKYGEKKAARAVLPAAGNIRRVSCGGL